LISVIIAYPPQCWDGVNLDSPDHQSHVSFPIELPDNGNCPASHPVRLPLVFFEILFSVDLDKFPHGNGVQPFVLACGDSTGYGLHGDFLNGWDQNIMHAVLHDVSCFDNNTNSGNNPSACKPLAPYVKASNPDQSCLLTNPLTNFEDIGVNNIISHLPGCMPITGKGSDAPVCTGAPFQQQSSFFYPRLRVLLKSKANGLYVSTATSETALTAGVVENQLTYNEVFTFVPMPGGGYAMMTEINIQYVSATSGKSGPLLPARPSPSTWETYSINYLNGDTRPTAAGVEVSITSWNGNLYASVQSNGQVWPSASAVGTNEIFYLIDADAASEAAGLWKNRKY